MAKTKFNDVKKSEWHYFSLEVIPEPNTEKYEMDILTWKTIILNSLNKLYGLVGEVREFDILSTKGTKSTIRTHVQDKDIFINSFFGYTFNLTKYIATELESVNAYIKVVRHADFLGLLSDDISYI